MKKICFITGSRADYGILHYLMKKFYRDKKTELQIIATNMHMSKKYGLTYKEILKDGLKINYRIKLPLVSNKPKDITKATGIALIGFAKTFEKLKPSLVVVLGDRYEILAASFAALSARIPIAHVAGGEASFGVIDDSIRHSISKMSNLHFVSTKEYRKRVIQLGENPKNIYLVGSLGVERIKKIKLLKKNEFEKKINISLENKTILFTYHPTMQNKVVEKKNIKEILFSLKKLKKTRIIFTLPNSDANSDIIKKSLISLSKKNKKKYKVFKSMGSSLYLSAIKHSNLVLGNSSSGIIEAPTLLTASINIGDRQNGRVKCKSVIDCKADGESILKAINKGISKKFNQKISKLKNPYEMKNTANKIFSIIKKINLKKLEKNKFFDLNF